MKNKFITAFAVATTVILMMASCTSQKKLTYFNNINKYSADSINAVFQSYKQTPIAVGDLLSIVVSGADPKAVVLFNSPVISYYSPNSENLYSQPILQNYLVGIDGDVNFPVLGKIKLGGLTKTEAMDLLTEKLEPYIKNPIVTIGIVNYKVTVMGEVLHPGQYQVTNDRTTILDAISMAGDLTIYGKRDDVLLVRETNGKLQFERIDLNSDDLFKSPYYYLNQNDLIYISPNNTKTIAAQNLPLYLSGISTLGTLITLVYTISKK